MCPLLSCQILHSRYVMRSMPHHPLANRYEASALSFLEHTLQVQIPSHKTISLPATSGLENSYDLHIAESQNEYDLLMSHKYSHSILCLNFAWHVR